jgi:ATP-dependent Lhr-like helicase
MEESGKVRRGYFVEGLGGAQFASAGAVDQLRSCRTDEEETLPLVLAATDPANPYGSLLPWPASPAGGSPRRVVGATVVLVQGALRLYLDRGARRALTFSDDSGSLVLAASALREVAARRRGRYLRLERLDGELARTSPRATLFGQAGFTPDHKGLVLEA